MEFNRDEYEKLHKDLSEKTQAFLKADKHFTSSHAFSDKEEVETYAIAKKEWQEAATRFYDLLSTLKKENII